MLALVAVLNGPVANAFIASHSPEQRLTIDAIHNIPLPATLPLAIASLVEEYVALSTKKELFTDLAEKLAELLTRIDTAVLEAYDLPPRLESQLLEFFTGAMRPIAQPWTHWDETHPGPGLRLSERLTGKFADRGAWISEVFKPLPEEEAALIRGYGA